MIQKGTWHFNMPTKVKDILVVLKEKAETKTCVEVADVEALISKTNWTVLPSTIDSALELLGVSTEKINKALPKWMELPSRVQLLETAVANLDCRAVSSTQAEVVDPKHISNITLIEYDAEEDLTGENETVNIKVFFEDKSGDETPNVGKKLYTDEELLSPLVGYKGAFYFIRPSNPSEKVTMLLRGTGTVKRTKFEV